MPKTYIATFTDGTTLDCASAPTGGWHHYSCRCQMLAIRYAEFGNGKTVDYIRIKADAVSTFKYTRASVVQRMLEVNKRLQK